MKALPPLPRFLRFCVVGALGFMVDVGVLYASAWALGWYGGRVLSFIAAASFTWWLNRRFTFATAMPHEQSPGRQYLGYMAAMLGGAVLNYSTYVATLHWVDGPASAAWGVAFGSCAGLLANYLSARHLVFRQSHG